MSPERARQLPLFDAISALVVGLVVVPLHGWIAELDQLPESVVLLSGIANVAYVVFGLSVVRWRKRSLVLLMVGANTAWAVVCVVLLALHGENASVFGWLHIGGEGLYVLTLALVEWRHRDAIAPPSR